MAQGYDEKEKRFIVHEVDRIRSFSGRLILSDVIYRGWKLFSHNVTQAYCQSMSELSREIYLQPRLEDLNILKIRPDELVRLLGPTYDICETEDYWGSALDQHLTDDLSMFSMKNNSGIYAWESPNSNEVSAVTGTYVEDSLNAGDNEFMKHTEATSPKCESKSRILNDLDFYGLQIKAVNRELFKTFQPFYTSHLKETLVDANLEMLKRDRAFFIWLTHFRPYICFMGDRAAHFSGSTFSIFKIRKLNKRIRIAKTTVPNAPSC